MDRGPRPESTCAADGVEAEAHQFVGRDIVPHRTDFDGLDHQTSNHLPEPVLGSDDLLVPMQE